MALTQSKYAKGILPVPTPSDAGGSVTKRFAHSVSSAPSANDILELGVLPAGCRITEIIVDGDDMDTGGSPALAIDVGFMSGDWGDNDGTRTCGAEFFSASTVLQAGGVARPTLKTAYRTAIVDYDRAIGVKFGTAAATFAAGEIGVTLSYAAD